MAYNSYVDKKIFTYLHRRPNPSYLRRRQTSEVYPISV